jgi:hypothetical protein
MALLCKKITAVKSKEVKTGCNMAESSMALLCPRWVVLPMMTMSMMKHLVSYT